MAQHRGRLQVQGRDLPGPGYSWAWNQGWPPRARTGLFQLEWLRRRLTARQQRLRDEAFIQAAGWMRTAAEHGGVAGPVRLTFQNRGLPRKHADARVDVEVHRGDAFGRDILDDP